jgi:hypothetical protein
MKGWIFNASPLILLGKIELEDIGLVTNCLNTKQLAPSN